MSRWFKGIRMASRCSAVHFQLCKYPNMTLENMPHLVGELHTEQRSSGDGRAVRSANLYGRSR